MTASANSTNERHLCSKPQSRFWQAPCRDKVIPTPLSPCTHRTAESTAAWEAPGSRITWSLDRKKQDAFPADNVSCCPKQLAVQKLATFATCVSGQGTRSADSRQAKQELSRAPRRTGRQPALHSGALGPSVPLLVEGTRDPAPPKSTLGAHREHAEQATSGTAMGSLCSIRLLKPSQICITQTLKRFKMNDN